MISCRRFIIVVESTLHLKKRLFEQLLSLNYWSSILNASQSLNTFLLTFIIGINIKCAH